MELKIIKKICDECISEGEKLSETEWDDIQNIGLHERIRGTYVDLEQFSSWKSNCLVLLNILGPNSDPWKNIFDGEKTNHINNFRSMLGGIKSIKNSLEKGYLIQFEDIVYAEAFDNLIEQAVYLHEQGYNLASGVIGRAVLEEKLRKLCLQHEIVIEKQRPTLSAYNAELYKAKVYNKIEYQNLVYLISIGNNAAHNEPITKKDIDKLIIGVKEILIRYN